MKRNLKGFTMIEIMLVVIIIGILAAMVIPNLSGRSKQAKTAAAKADIDANLATSLDLFEVDLGRYPTTEEGLRALIEAPGNQDVSDKWSGPYLKKKKMPLDPWGHEYSYRSPGQHGNDYDLFSLGADGTESADDVVNWDANADGK